MRSQLKKIEDLGAAMEEALILDNKYTEHSTVGLAQQWDQLDQLGMRMQHNLEQQIQARYLTHTLTLKLFIYIELCHKCGCANTDKHISSTEIRQESQRRPSRSSA